MSTSPSSTTLTKRPLSSLSAAALMPPPAVPPTKRIKRPPKVLSEEVYESTLSHIIARDFFPGLLETQAQQDYLDALDSKDDTWISDAGRRLEAAMTPVAAGTRRGRRGVSMMFTPMLSRDGTPAATPREWATPASTPGAGARSEAGTMDEAEEKERKDDEERRNMSLAAFQSKYTSEDNESFNALLDKQNERKARKFAWMWDGNRMPSARRIAQDKVKQRRLLLGQNDDRKPGLSDDLTARKAMADVAPCPPRNALMFIPEGLDEDTIVATSDTTAETSQQNKAPKSIAFTNTRLPNPDVPADRSTRASSPTPPTIDRAVATGRYPAQSEASVPGPGDTPRVNGYAFVDEEPSDAEKALAERDRHPEPGADEGSLLFARLTADAAERGGAAGAQFSINESSRREKLHHRMVERSAATKRAGAADASSSTSVAGVAKKTVLPDTPRFLSYPRTPVAVAAGSTAVGGGLTPAARRLLDRVGGTPAGRSRAGGFGGGDGSRKDWWTPGATPKAQVRK